MNRYDDDLSYDGDQVSSLRTSDHDLSVDDIDDERPWKGSIFPLNKPRNVRHSTSSVVRRGAFTRESKDTHKHSSFDESRLYAGTATDQNHTNRRQGKTSIFSNNLRTSAKGGSHKSLDGTNLDRISAIEISGDTISVATAAAIVRDGNLNNTKYYNKGEYALVDIYILGLSSEDETTAVPVNKYGFPEGKGKAVYHRQGPYDYVLTSIQSVHFGEDARYYMVKREDTCAIQRADAEYMETIRKEDIGFNAALDAAKCTTSQAEVTASTSAKFCIQCICLSSCFSSCRKAYKAIEIIYKDQATKITSGDAPYRIRITFTTVNFLVLCGLIVAFLDQLKYAFFPKSADFALGIVFFAAWVVLVLELISELCIRPDNYHELLQNEMAYNPYTVRYINRFHLFLESLAVIFAIPDFLPIFGVNPFIDSIEASIMATVGYPLPSFILGQVYFFTTRLRLCNLVRHKRNHWINALYLNKKDARRTHFEARDVIKDVTNPSKQTKKKSDDESKNEDDKLLLNAATIGSALLLVNSHRAMILLLFITFFIPFITSATVGGPNLYNQKMTQYLHDVNKLVPSEGPTESDCSFYNSSVNA